MPLHSFLLSRGFESSRPDQSVHVQRRNSTATLMVVYVHDVQITGNDPTMLNKLVDAIRNQINSRADESPNRFLRIIIEETATYAKTHHATIMEQILSSFY